MIKKDTPPLNTKVRDSNLELYRICCMLMIVAHHFVTSSGLNALDGPIKLNPDSINSVFLVLFGMWGKTGINCFLMITGYFMCTSKITIKKFAKLFLEVLFYNIVIYTSFVITGYETFNVRSILVGLMPVWGFTDMFTSCFLAFYLFIPFLTVFVKNISRRQHQMLLLLLLGCYTFLGSVPTFNVTFNYITWFGVIFLIASYIRLHPSPQFEKKSLWGWITIGTVLIAMISVYLMHHYFRSGYYFVADSNKVFAVAVAVSSFLWFKNMRVPQSRFINMIGASTFGVLLIHANSSAMRIWLWKDTFNCVDHYSTSLLRLIVFSISTVFLVFIVCVLIDQIRIHLIERPFFKWYGKYLDRKFIL